MNWALGKQKTLIVSVFLLCLPEKFSKIFAYFNYLYYLCSEFNPKVVVIATIFVVRNMLWIYKEMNM